MAYLAVEKTPKKQEFKELIVRNFRENYPEYGNRIWYSYDKKEKIVIPNGTIEQLLGRKLSYKEHPVEWDFVWPLDPIKKVTKPIHEIKFMFLQSPKRRDIIDTFMPDFKYNKSDPEMANYIHFLKEVEKRGLFDELLNQLN
jgi:hypothetical protein